MSWDIFVQDIPRHIASVEEIPDDFKPQSLGPRLRIVDAIRRVAPFADMSDPSWIRIEGHGCDIEVNLSHDDPVQGFAFHIRGGESSVDVVAATLAELGLRAFDPESDTGLFDASTAGASFERWLALRDRALGTRRQLTLFVPEPERSVLGALRSSFDPAQASLIAAHVTLCREDEIEQLDPAAVLSRVESWAQGPLRLGFGSARVFDGYGVLLLCEYGAAEFHRLRQWLLQDQRAREHAAHLTLAHPRNPRAAGNTATALAACPRALELRFPTVALIEQHGFSPWRVLQEATLGGIVRGVV